MTKRMCAREKTRLLFSLGFVLILVIATWLLFPLRFQTNDDSAIAYTIAGYRTGQPTGYNVYTSGLFGFPVSWLYTLVPQVPWYSVLILTSIFISYVCMVKSFLKLTKNIQQGFWVSLSAFMLLYLTLLLKYSYSIQFTVTTATSASGAFCLFLSAAREDGKGTKRLDFLLFVFLFWLGVSLRVTVGYIVVMLFALLFLKDSWHALRMEKPRMAKGQFIAYLCVTSVLALSSFTFESLYIKTHANWQEYQAYNKERVQLMDYNKLRYDDAPEFFESIGWSRELTGMVKQNWFFLDKRVNRENFAAINQYASEHFTTGEARLSPLEKWVEVRASIWTVSTQRAKVIYGIIAFANVCVWCIIELFRRKQFFDTLWMVGYLASLFVLLIFLAWRGRFVERLEYAVVIPYAVIAVWMLLFHVIGQGQAGKGMQNVAFIDVCCACCLAGLIASASFYATETVFAPKDNPGVSVRKQVETYAIEHGENIYIYDTTVSMGADFLTVYPDSIPNNVFLFGGTTVYSPIHDAQMAALGYPDLNAEDFFDERIYFITRTDRNFVEVFFALMAADYGATGIETVDMISDNLRVYRFKR